MVSRGSSPEVSEALSVVSFDGTDRPANLTTAFARRVQKSVGVGDGSSHTPLWIMAVDPR